MSCENEICSEYESLKRDLRKIKLVFSDFMKKTDDGLVALSQESANSIGKKCDLENLNLHLSKFEEYQKKMHLIVSENEMNMHKAFKELEEKINSLQYGKVSLDSHLNESKNLHQRIDKNESCLGMLKDQFGQELIKNKIHCQQDIAEFATDILNELEALKDKQKQHNSRLDKIDGEVYAVYEQLKSLISRVLMSEKKIEHVYITFKRNNLEVRY